MKFVWSFNSGISSKLGCTSDLFVVLDLIGGRTARGRRLRFLLQYAHVLGRLQEYLVLAERRQRLPVLLLLLVVPLHLGPSVLEPRDHLRVGQAQAGRDLVPVGRRQVLLVQETFLQLEYLVIGESGAWLALLLGLRPRVEQVQVIGTGVCEQKIDLIRISKRKYEFAL